MAKGLSEHFRIEPVETVGVYEDGQPGEVFIANGRNKITRMAPAEYIGRYMPEWRDSPGTGHAGSSRSAS
jgi:hypothetical protein